MTAGSGPSSCTPHRAAPDADSLLSSPTFVSPPTYMTPPSSMATAPAPTPEFAGIDQTRSPDEEYFCSERDVAITPSLFRSAATPLAVVSSWAIGRRDHSTAPCDDTFAMKGPSALLPSTEMVLPTTKASSFPSRARPRRNSLSVEPSTTSHNSSPSRVYRATTTSRRPFATVSPATTRSLARVVLMRFVPDAFVERSWHTSPTVTLQATEATGTLRALPPPAPACPPAAPPVEPGRPAWPPGPPAAALPAAPPAAPPVEAAAPSVPASPSVPPTPPAPPPELC